MIIPDILKAEIHQKVEISERGILALGLLILGGYIGWNLYSDRRQIEFNEQDRLATQARVIDENLGGQLVAVDNALTSIRDDLPFLLAQQDSLDHLNHRLQSLSASMPAVRTLFVLNGEGKAIASNRADLIGRDLHERAYFQIARQSNDPAILHVSSPIKNALGADAINLERSRIDSKGAFTGLVAATLDPEYFDTLLRSVNYAPDMWTTLAHEDGTLFIMVPERHIASAGTANNASLSRRHRESGQNATLMIGTTLAAGEERMIARCTVRPASVPMDRSLVIATTRSMNALLAPWRREVSVQGGWFGLLTLITSGALFLFQKRKRETVRLATIYEQERKAAEDALRESEERWHFALEGARDGVWDRNLETGKIFFSRRCWEMLGYSDGELGETMEAWEKAVHPKDIAAAIAAIQAHLDGTVPFYAAEYRMKCKDGRWKWIFARGMVVSRSADGKPLRIIGTRSDITEHKRLEAKLRQSEERYKELSRTDPLTGLANRRVFNETLEAEFLRSRRFGSGAALLMIDIDHFKRVNDTYGHEAGDAAVVSLATTLKSMARATDLPSRYGGEEFVFLLTGTDLPGAVEMADRIRKTVSQIVVTSSSGAFGFTVSIGVASFADEDKGWTDSLNRADQAMYQAKQSGRNRVVANGETQTVE